MTTIPTPRPDPAALIRAAMERLNGSAVKLERSGWVELTVGETTVRLRPPFLGEYRRFRRASTASAEQLATEAVDEALTAADRDERALARTVAWWRDVVDTLGTGGALPDDVDAWPIWLVENSTPIVGLYTHWREVPGGPGGPGR